MLAVKAWMALLEIFQRHSEMTVKIPLLYTYTWHRMKNTTTHNLINLLSLADVILNSIHAGAYFLSNSLHLNNRKYTYFGLNLSVGK